MGAPYGPGSRPTDEAASASSPKASIPSAVTPLLAKPFSVYGQPVTGRQIADVIDALANLPEQFIAMDVVSRVLPGASFHDKQEALNRLFQRWRKVGVAEFKRGKWKLTRGAWDRLQASAIEARSAETTGSARQGESADPQGDAQTQSHIGRGTSHDG